MADSATPFRPDWASPPGDTISDLLEERDWSQIELARRLGYTTKHVSLLINGKAPITEDTALRLERVFGGSAGFWLAREAQYREQLARVNEAERFAAWAAWVDELPVKELMAVGAIAKRRIDAKAKPPLAEELLRFFGVASPDEWEKHYRGMEVAFRRTREEQSDVGAISAWLRLGEKEAEKLNSPKYDRSLFADALNRIRGLTMLAPQQFEPVLRKECWDAGVALVLVPAVPRAHVSGAARWLNPHKPLIQLSLYGKTNDRFWFTFFHEAAHILLHDKKEVFLDESQGTPVESTQENEADAWSRNMLIPDAAAKELASLRTKDAVRAFAKRLKIHPGIVVGRLQHEKLIERTWMNNLKVSFRFAEIQ